MIWVGPRLQPLSSNSWQQRKPEPANWNVDADRRQFSLPPPANHTSLAWFVHPFLGESPGFDNPADSLCRYLWCSTTKQTQMISQLHQGPTLWGMLSSSGPCWCRRRSPSGTRGDSPRALLPPCSGKHRIISPQPKRKVWQKYFWVSFLFMLLNM